MKKILSFALLCSVLLTVGCAEVTSRTKPTPAATAPVASTPLTTVPEPPKTICDIDYCRRDSDCPLPGEPNGGPEGGPSLYQCVNNKCVRK